MPELSLSANPRLSSCWVETRRSTTNWNEPVCAPADAVALSTFSSPLVAFFWSNESPVRNLAAADSSALSAELMSR